MVTIKVKREGEFRRERFAGFNSRFSPFVDLLVDR
jgi:hypothetical protein